MEKVALNKGRLFYVADLILNLVMRQYLLPLNSYLLELPHLSKLVVTMNAGSSQWKELYTRLTRHGKKRVFADDQKEYDNRHSILVAHLAKMYYRLALKCGYSKKDARICERLMVLASRYLLLMDGDLFLCASRWCSGRMDTIMGNGIMGCIIMMYAYMMSALDLGLNPSFDDFWDEVEMAFTGDDNVTGVSPTSHFLPRHHQVYASKLGYIVTRADKSEGYVEFEDISEIDYLQRRFVPRGDDVMAPIHPKSIYKSLVYYAGRFTPEQLFARNMSCIHSAQREAFMHGRDFFDQIVAETSGYEFTPTPLDFDELAEEYREGTFQMWHKTYFDGFKPSKDLPDSHIASLWNIGHSSEKLVRQGLISTGGLVAGVASVLNTRF